MSICNLPSPFIFNCWLLLFALNLFSCSSNSLNQISEKKIKNEITGEVEEYRVIKISEDVENDYFLEVRIPDGYKQVSWERLGIGGDATLSEFIPQDHFEHRNISNFRISKEFNSDKSLEKYVLFRKRYIELAFKVRRSFVKYENFNNRDRFSDVLKSATIIQETDCSNKTHTICLPNEREINIIKVYRGKTNFWTIEFTGVIEGYLLEAQRDKVVAQYENTVEDCCKISRIRKLENESQN